MSIFSYLRGSGSGQSSLRNARGTRARDIVARACTLEQLEVRRFLTATNPQVISVSTAGAVGNNDSPPLSASAPGFGPKISDSGRYVVFDSSATNLDPTHPASADEVYLRDTVKNTTTMVSLNPNGQPIPNSYVADISGDGRYVLFFGTANNTTFLYRRDTVTNSTIVASVGYNEFTRSPLTIGVSADPVTHLPTFPAAISADGSRVAFATPNRFVVQSHNDQNATDDIYVRDLNTGTNYWISTTLSETPTSPLHGEQAYSFAMNAAGTEVVYDSDESLSSTTGLRRRVNLHSIPANSTIDVSNGLATSASTGTNVVQSLNPTISKDGSTVAFLSDDPVLSGAAAGSTTTIPLQVILVKLNNFSNSVLDVTVASQQRGGGPSFGAADFTPRLSSDGNFVAFWDDGTDLVSNPTSNTSLYRYDYRNDKVALVSTNSTGVGATNFDPRIGMSNDGRFIAWASDATGADLSVTSYGTAGQQNVFARDMNSFTIRLMNVSSADGTLAANGDAGNPALSADGKFIAFDSTATDLNPADTTPTSDVYQAPVPVFPPASMTPLLNAPDVLIGGGTAYYFTVTYNSSLPVKISTIGDGDVTVTYGPLGYNAVAKLLPGSITLSTDGTPVSATYFVTPPGGSWDVTDNTLDATLFNNPPRYTVHLNASEVTDIQGNPFPDQVLGSFRVDISYPNEAGSSNAVSVAENTPSHTVTVPVTRTDLLPGNISVNFSTVQGTASPGQDYTDTTGTLTFAPGETKNIVIPILDDSILEGNETFRIVLSGATSGALFSWGQTTVTILDNESPSSPPGGGTVVVPPNSPVGVAAGQGGSTISLEDGVPVVRAPETIVTNYGAGELPITISRADTGTVGTPITFNYTVYSTPSDSAIGNQNFVAATGTLSFGATESSKDLVVQLLHDHQVTGDRTFTVVLTNATNGLVVGGASIRVVVQDVDSAVQFSTAAITTNDDAGVIDIPVTRIGNTTPGSKVHVAFPGSAVNGVDFSPINDGTVDEFGDITFAPGETSKVLHVQLLSRPFNPGTSTTLNVTLSNPRALATSDPFAYETVLGTPSTEAITINNLDATAPQVAGVDFKLKNGRISTVLVTFNENVNGTAARKLTNYALFARTRTGQLGQLIRLTSAKYDPSTNTVTLTPVAPLAANQIYQINVNGAGNITDTAGNRFDGDANGRAGGSFNGIFGYGRALSYADKDNDLVSFSLKGPGNLKISSLNSGVTVDVLNPDADNTTLLGTVTKRKPGNGKTTLALLRLRGATFDADQSKFEGDIRADV